MSKPSPSSHPGYFQQYIDLVPEADLQLAFNNQLQVIIPFLNGITEEKSKYTYAAGKWTIKELMQHVTDTERIFAYRALSFARGEQANLPGFEEDDYAANSNANNQSWQQLMEEFLAVRKATHLLFNSFNESVLEKSGSANNNPASVGSMGFITLGHFYHHKKVLEQRYLSQ
jgi:DinB superfamily